ncbi:MAG: aldo/keto reductase, partial [Clostridiales bacterium]|nr:aldo/keto reductase [Clostridiales bacterium]
MRTMALGKTGIVAGAVAFGGIINMNETQADADRFVAAAIERGVNYFDVAPSYGDAEERLGPALRPYREGVYLACKTGRRDAGGAKAELLASLDKLHTDHFDVYQLHAMTTRADIEQAFAPGGAMETFLWARREGLVKNLGFSAHNEDTALQLLDRFDFDTVLFPVNWAMGLVNGWGDRLADRVREKGIGLLALKALVRRKWLEGEEHIYPKSWCQPIFGD